MRHMVLLYLIEILVSKVIGFGILGFIFTRSEIAAWMDEGKSFGLIYFDGCDVRIDNKKRKK